MTFLATLFDFNGVLVDDEAVHLEAFREALQQGIPGTEGVAFPDERYWSHYIGFDDVEGFRAILADAGRPSPDALLRELVAAKKPLYLRRAQERLDVFPGAADVLRARAAAGPVVVVSGALHDEVELGLTVLGVRDLVKTIVAAEATTASKPDPQGYHLGLEALCRHGAGDPARAMVIEDSESGVQAAKAAGLACFAVEHSTPREALLAAGADVVVERIADLDEARIAGEYERLAS